MKTDKIKVFLEFEIVKIFINNHLKKLNRTDSYNTSHETIINVNWSKKKNLLILKCENSKWEYSFITKQPFISKINWKRKISEKFSQANVVSISWVMLLLIFCSKQGSWGWNGNMPKNWPDVKERKRKGSRVSPFRPCEGMHGNLGKQKH